MTVGLLSFASFLSTFNGGKSQVGPWNPAFDNSYPFLNCFLIGAGWINNGGTSNGGSVDPSTLDNNGNPTTATQNCVQNFTIPSQTNRPGNYVLGWTGSATTGGAFTNTPVTYSVTNAVSSGVNTVLTIPSLSAGPTGTNILVVGQSLTFSTFTAPWTGANGTFNVVAVNVGGNVTQVSINFNSSALAAYSSNGGLGTSLKTSPNSVGRYVFSTSSTQINWGPSVINSNLSGFYCCHVDDEVSYLAGAIFGKKFVSVIQGLNPGVLRNLDWFNPNASQVSTWSTRKSISYCTYIAPEYRPPIYCGQSTNTGNAFSFTGNSGTTINGGPGQIPNSGGPTDRLTLHLQWSGAQTTISQQSCTVANNASSSAVSFASPHGFSGGEIVCFNGGNSPPNGLASSICFYVIVVDSLHIDLTLTVGGTAIATTGGGTNAQTLQTCCTLSMNGTAPIAIMGQDGDAISTAPHAHTIIQYDTLVYEAQLNCWLLSQNTGIVSGPPPEIFVQLCARVGAYPHLVAPYLSVDPVTDYNPSLASYIKTTYPWMKPHFEGVNECWNNGNQGTQYGYLKGYINWGTQFDIDNWYGKITSTLGQSINTVYPGGLGTSAEVMCAFQTSVMGSLFASQAHNDRFAASRYVAQSTPAQSGFTKDPAYKWASKWCCAQYWNPGDFDSAQEVANGFALNVTNAGNSSAQNAIAAAYTATGVVGGTCTVTIASPAVFTSALPHGLNVGDFIGLATTGALPTGVHGGYVVSTPSGTTFTVSTTPNGTAYTSSGTQSGTHAFGRAAPSASFSIPILNIFYLNIANLAASQPAGSILNGGLGYEGGYSPDYNTSNNYTSALTGATISSPGGNCVITLPAIINALMGSTSTVINPAAAVGMPLTISGVVGMTGLNNSSINSAVTFTGTTVNWTNTFAAGQSVYFSGGSLSGIAAFIPVYVMASGLSGSGFQVEAVKGSGTPLTLTGSGVTGQACWVVTQTGVGGDNTMVAINFDSSAQSAWVSGGTATYVNATGNVTALRAAGKYVPLIQGYTTTNYNNFTAAGGLFPSHYALCGANADWFLYDPTIYGNPNTQVPASPQAAAIAAFNN